MFLGTLNPAILNLPIPDLHAEVLHIEPIKQIGQAIRNYYNRGGKYARGNDFQNIAEEMCNKLQLKVASPFCISNAPLKTKGVL